MEPLIKFTIEELYSIKEALLTRQEWVEDDDCAPKDEAPHLKSAIKKLSIEFNVVIENYGK